MAWRRLYFTPSGRALTVVLCSKTIFLRGRRKATRRWFERLQTFDGWVVGVYAENEDALWLYSALTGMWGKPGTGGLRHNLKATAEANVVYEVQWPGTGLRVALCDQDPAFEGGLGKLLELEKMFLRKDISIPPAISRAREIKVSFPDVEAIMLPASPFESNAMRLALARVILIKPEALKRIEEPDHASTLDSPLRLLPRLLKHRAPDRMASLEEPPGRKLWTAPRLAYSLMRRRIAQVKDWLRRVLVEKPGESLSSLGEFLADLPKEKPSELVKAIGYLVRSLLEGWAAVLAALAALIGALAQAGLFS